MNPRQFIDKWQASELNVRSAAQSHFNDLCRLLGEPTPAEADPLGESFTFEYGVRKRIVELIEKSKNARRQAEKTKAYNQAEKLYQDFLARLRNLRLLDPACGSGNFLYLALKRLKDLEHRVCLDAESLGLQREFPRIGPESVLGLELSPYAAELARVTVWIGEIQWMLQHGFSARENPILSPLETIECRDALLAESALPERAECPLEADWPDAEIIVGNPPFLGGSKILGELGETYTENLRKCYSGKVPGGADLVTYWFEKARGQLASGKAKRTGFVATNSIRGGSNRKVFEHIRESGTIFEAWSNEPWTLEGAAVRVSLICFAKKENATKIRKLDEAVAAAYGFPADLPDEQILARLLEMNLG